MASQAKPLAVVTGASSGIGLALAQLAANDGYDLIIAADRPLDAAVAELGPLGVKIQAVQTDLATQRGIDELTAKIAERPVALLFANAGHGLGKAFLDQDFDEIRHVLNTNITGTIDLIHRVARTMRQHGAGRILITGSIAGFQPGSFQAVYNGSKAFIDSFSLALRDELKGTGVTVTCLMPGVTDTEFFERADLMDTKVGTMENKADPAEVARIGYEALLAGEADVIAGMKNKAQVAMSKVLPAEMVATQHRKMAQPGTAKN
jgi:short-subunit dehydrogenase